MTGISMYRMNGVDAFLRTIAGFEFTGHPALRALEDVIWEQGRRAQSLREEITRAIRSARQDFEYMMKSIEDPEGRRNRDVYEPLGTRTAEDDVYRLVGDANDLERILRTLCKAATDAYQSLRATEEAAAVERIVAAHRAAGPIVVQELREATPREECAECEGNGVNCRAHRVQPTDLRR